MVETMSPEFVNFIGDAYRSLKYTNHLEKPWNKTGIEYP